LKYSVPYVGLEYILSICIIYFPLKLVIKYCLMSSRLSKRNQVVSARINTSGFSFNISSLSFLLQISNLIKFKLLYKFFALFIAVIDISEPVIFIVGFLSFKILTTLPNPLPISKNYLQFLYFNK